MNPLSNMKSFICVQKGCRMLLIVRQIKISTCNSCCSSGLHPLINHIFPATTYAGGKV